MKSSKKFSAEVRERAVRLVGEARKDYDSEWATLCSIAPKIGCTTETLRKSTSSGFHSGGGNPRWASRGQQSTHHASSAKTDHAVRCTVTRAVPNLNCGPLRRSTSRSGSAIPTFSSCPRARCRCTFTAFVSNPSIRASSSA